MSHVHTRKGYEGIAVAVPVTVPYVRYSTRSAHWFLGQAIHKLVEQSGIRKDQIDCMGCLSACGFSNWSQNEEGTTGRKADPRSFCIQKTLQNIAHDGSVEAELMFAGHNAYRFGQDPWYKDGFVPTVKQLVERIATELEEITPAAWLTTSAEPPSI